MTQDTAVATRPAAVAGISASAALASRIGIEQNTMLQVIKAQCFPGTDARNISNETLAAFVNIAHALNVNPLLPGMIYAYPDKGGNGGFKPMIGPDGVHKLLSEHPDVLGWDWEYEYAEDGKGALVACTAVIYRTAPKRDVRKRIIVSEWRTPNWDKRPTHFAEMRSLKQAARFIIHGIPDDGNTDGDATALVTAVVTDVPPVAGEPTTATRAKAAARTVAAARTRHVAATTTAEPAAPHRVADNDGPGDDDPELPPATDTGEVQGEILDHGDAGDGQDHGDDLI